MTVELRALTKRFGNFPALHGVDLAVAEGEFVALLGPSGSGKTTLLRIIAGLETAERGVLFINGRDARHLPARERNIGFVFQHYALFRHMRVAENIAFGLTVRKRRQRPSRSAIRQRVDELIRLVQLDGYGDRFPTQLSGGQRQRVALARALAVDPAVLLLDEPFGALDAKVRVELRLWLHELHRTLGLTTIFVTHDQEEALLLADRVAILNAGRIEQTGTPAEIYDRPASAFVTEFLGAANRLDGEIRGGKLILASDGQPLELPPTVLKGCSEGPVVAFVRPHEVVLGRGAARDNAVVRAVAVSGPRYTVEIDFRGSRLVAETARDAGVGRPLASGDRIAARVANAIVFPAGGRAKLGYRPLPSGAQVSADVVPRGPDEVPPDAVKQSVVTP
jgi:sulfate transport system ATP-binding protein